MALINTTTTGIQGSTFVADGTGSLTIQQNGQTLGIYGNIPAFSAKRTSTQSLSSATFTKVQLNSEDYDTSSLFDSSTNFRFTPNITGYYQINGTLDLEPGSGSGTIFVGSIYKNGSEFLRLFDLRVSSTLANFSGSTVMYFNGTTDYIELYAYITATSPIIGSAYLSGFLAKAA